MAIKVEDANKVGTWSSDAITDRDSISFSGSINGGLIVAGSGTSMFINSSTATAVGVNTMMTNPIVDNSVYKEYFGTDNKKRAIRVPKKKRGDKTGKNDPRDRINSVDTVVLFSFLKSRFSIIQSAKLSKKYERVSELLEMSKKTSQIALSDMLMEKFGAMIREQEMLVCGYKYFFTPEQLNRFINACEKRDTIKLTKVKNYIRVIPKKIRDKMEKAKEKMLFDDFFVLHTDPENKAIAKTAEEKKDPILFGVVRESKNYYFIDDWIDEHCDITMKKVLEVLDIDAPEISDDIEATLVEKLFSEL
jgi:acyl carrier protein